MIVMEDDLYIAEGLARICYQHPDNEHLCLKIGKPHIEERDLNKEIDYYKKIRKKDPTKFDYRFYTKYHGETTTDRGIGHIYDLVRDETTNKVSKTLRDYLEMDVCPFSDVVIYAALARLKKEMITQKIIASDMRARNICCKILKDNTIELVIVDGIGHRDFFPLADYFQYFTKKKIERRFVKADLHDLDIQRKLLKRLIAEGIKTV